MFFFFLILFLICFFFRLSCSFFSFSRCLRFLSFCFCSSVSDSRKESFRAWTLVLWVSNRSSWSLVKVARRASRLSFRLRSWLSRMANWSSDKEFLKASRWLLTNSFCSCNKASWSGVRIFSMPLLPFLCTCWASSTSCAEVIPLNINAMIRNRDCKDFILF